MKSLIEPEFDGLFVVSQENTGVTVSNYKFDRYCTLLDGLTKMLKSKGYRLKLTFQREENEPGYLYIEAVQIVDYSDQIELSQDCQLNYTMDDKRDGVNHLIVTGKGELQDRNVLHLYVQEDGSLEKHSIIPACRRLRRSMRIHQQKQMNWRKRLLISCRS